MENRWFTVSSMYRCIEEYGLLYTEPLALRIDARPRLSFTLSAISCNRGELIARPRVIVCTSMNVDEKDSPRGDGAFGTDATYDGRETEPTMSRELSREQERKENGSPIAVDSVKRRTSADVDATFVYVAFGP